MIIIKHFFLKLFIIKKVNCFLLFCFWGEWVGGWITNILHTIGKYRECIG